MKNVKLITLLLIMFLFQGCGETDITIDIERDGDISYVYPDDVSEKIKSDDNVDFEFRDIQRTFVYNSTNIEVDNNIYNFMIVIPLKSKTNIRATLKKYSNKDTGVIAHFFGLSIEYVTQKEADGYYHYNFYIPSNYHASNYYLNDIKNFTQKFAYKYYGYFSDNVDIDTNTFTIQAQGLEELLERLAISHIRLDFQPEGY